MADQDDPADAALRLERALERIASRARAQAAVPSLAVPSLAVPDTGAVAVRLDALIAQMRQALSGGPGS